MFANLEIPSLVHHLLLALVLAEGLCLILKRMPLWRWVGILRLVVAGVGLVWISVQGNRIPLYGPFEALTYLIFVTGILGFIFGRRDLRAPALWSTAWILGLFALLWKQPMALNEDYYMYDNLLVLLFFNLRILSGAFFIHGAAQYLAAAHTPGKALFHAGRNTLLLAICIYLCSEWTGSLWCLNWYGDSWHWSRGFLKAAILFLLTMGAFHLPGQLVRHRILKAGAGVIPGLFMVWMLFYH